MTGPAFGRRAMGGDALALVIGRFDGLLIAEATTHRTPLVGRTLGQSGLREKVGVSVVGVWERGSFHSPRPETVIQDNTILVLAGTVDHLQRYDELFCIYNVSGAPTVILGGGRVGRATARALVQRDVDYRCVEVQPELVRDPARDVLGSAADLEVLKKAGIEDAPTVIITPHDDDLNVYLTIYCRRLRPDIQIISRATLERTIATLHRAGADIVMSYAGTGASTIMNWLKHSKILTVAEGLDVFRVPVPAALAGKRIGESSIREQTGCTVVGIGAPQGMEIVPGPSERLPADADMLLIGTAEAEERFLALWGDRTPRRRAST